MKYFEQQVYPPHVDYFDYEHMNNIIKQVTSFQQNIEHDKSNMTQFLNSPITAEEIKNAIQKLKCKKAAGVDGISAEFYKYGFNELLPALEFWFNTILTNGEYPDPEVCNDNDPYQAGFKSNSRTTDNIFILCAIIDKQKCLSKPLYTCFVNFTKAFHYIDRTALYYKLLNRGIDGNLLNIIRSMFSKAECRVKWDLRISDILKRRYAQSQTIHGIFTRHIRNI